MISKLAAWAPTRQQAIDRLLRALADYHVHGIATNIHYLRAVLDHPAFRSGRLRHRLLHHLRQGALKPPDPALEPVALIAAAVAAHRRDHDRADDFATRAHAPSPAWVRMGRLRALRGGGAVTATTYVALLDGGKREETLRVERVGPGVYEVTLRGVTHRVDAFHHDHGTISLLVDTESYSVQLDERGNGMRVHLRDSIFPLEILDERRARMRRSPGKLTADGRMPLVARLPGKVVGRPAGPRRGGPRGRGRAGRRGDGDGERDSQPQGR